MINDKIRVKEVRLIDEEGTMIGVVSNDDAQKRADVANLDLVMISPKAEPPVCKIMDYGKYFFEQAKKEKEAKKKQKVVNIKEIRLSASIDEHDIEFKLKNALKFLKSGDKVKVSIRFRGREMSHTNLGTQAMNKFAERIGENGVVETKPKLEGRSMTMIIGPNS